MRITIFSAHDIHSYTRGQPQIALVLSRLQASVSCILFLKCTVTFNFLIAEKISLHTIEFITVFYDTF